ncbi:MAG: SymE family type I addiction module toxin [Chthoniobacteraceae bacterium]
MRKVKQHRFLKVGQLQHSRVYGSIPVPSIRLIGLWLEEAGFTFGRSVEVNVEAGRIIIGCQPEELTPALQPELFDQSTGDSPWHTNC